MVILRENKENLLTNYSKIWQIWIFPDNVISDGGCLDHMTWSQQQDNAHMMWQAKSESFLKRSYLHIRATDSMKGGWKCLTIGKFSSKHDSTWAWHPETVEQRIMAKVEVDKCGFNSNLGKTQPKCHLQRPALHEKGHHVPWNPPLSSRPMGHCVGQLIQLCKGPCFSCGLIDQGWFIWVLFNCLGKYGKYVTSTAHVTPQRQLHSQKHTQAAGEGQRRKTGSNKVSKRCGAKHKHVHNW